MSISILIDLLRAIPASAYKWAAIVIAAVAAFFTAYSLGVSDGRDKEKARHEKAIKELEAEWAEQFEDLTDERNRIAEEAAAKAARTETIIREVEVPVTVGADCRLPFSVVERMRDVALAGRRAAEAGADADNAENVPGGASFYQDRTAGVEQPDARPTSYDVD